MFVGARADEVRPTVVPLASIIADVASVEAAGDVVRLVGHSHHPSKATIKTRAMPNVSRTSTRSAKPNPLRPSILLIPWGFVYAFGRTAKISYFVGWIPAWKNGLNFAFYSMVAGSKEFENLVAQCRCTPSVRVRFPIGCEKERWCRWRRGATLREQGKYGIKSQRGTEPRRIVSKPCSTGFSEQCRQCSRRADPRCYPRSRFSHNSTPCSVATQPYPLSISIENAKSSPIGPLKGRYGFPNMWHLR
jgi:hypothetical protein